MLPTVRACRGARERAWAHAVAAWRTASEGLGFACVTCVKMHFTVTWLFWPWLLTVDSCGQGAGPRGHQQANIRWTQPLPPAAFSNEIYLFSRLSIWRSVSGDYDDAMAGYVAIAKETLKLCRWAMLLHSDENDKRLLNCPSSSTRPDLRYPNLPTRSAAGKLFVFVFAFAFKLVWATSKNVNSYVLFKVLPFAGFELFQKATEAAPFARALTAQTKLLYSHHFAFAGYELNLSFKFTWFAEIVASRGIAVICHSLVRVKVFQPIWQPQTAWRAGSVFNIRLDFTGLAKRSSPVLILQEWQVVV